jgi:hypothetical protein
MSVDKRRLAAAQRTAVGSRNPSRARRLGAWIIILPALAVFSFSVVAGAAASQSKPGLESAAAKVVPQGHDEGHGNGESRDQKRDDGTLVVVDSSHGGGGINGLLGKGGHEICWISKSQLTRVSAVYSTTTSTIKVGQTTYSLVTVFGANEKTLKQLLGTSGVQCKLVHVAHLFFLPFDPNLS